MAKSASCSVHPLGHSVPSRAERSEPGTGRRGDGEQAQRPRRPREPRWTAVLATLAPSLCVRRDADYGPRRQERGHPQFPDGGLRKLRRSRQVLRVALNRRRLAPELHHAPLVAGV